jgi:hypothetical protein
MKNAVFSVQYIRQEMYKQRNVKARLCDNFCSLKARSMIHYKCAFLALGTRHARRIRRIVICGLPRLYSIFPHCLIRGRF